MANSCTFTGGYRNDPRGPKFKDGGPHNAGPDGWKFLHLCALDGKLSMEMVKNFARCIECPGCQTHFLQIIKDAPIPPDADPDKQFEMTVHWHNMVNESRDVPTIALSDARKIWSTEGNEARRAQPLLRRRRSGDSHGQVLAAGNFLQVEHAEAPVVQVDQEHGVVVEAVVEDEQRPAFAVVLALHPDGRAQLMDDGH